MKMVAIAAALFAFAFAGGNYVLNLLREQQQQPQTVAANPAPPAKSPETPCAVYFVEHSKDSPEMMIIARGFHDEAILRNRLADNDLTASERRRVEAAIDRFEGEVERLGVCKR